VVERVAPDQQQMSRPARGAGPHRLIFGITVTRGQVLGTPSARTADADDAYPHERNGIGKVQPIRASSGIRHNPQKRRKFR
jgi:hypothetical protein